MVQRLTTGDRTGLWVTRRETFIHPRKLALSRSGSPVEGRREGGGGREGGREGRREGGREGGEEEGVKNEEISDTSLCVVM